MRTAQFGILMIVALLIGQTQAQADTRKFACAFKTTTSQNVEKVAPGKSVAVDETAIGSQLSELVAAGKPAVVSVTIKDESYILAVNLNIRFGMQCAVVEAPGCQKTNQGPMIHKTQISITDKSTGQSVVMETGNVSGLSLEREFPSLYFAPLHQVQDANGDLVKTLGVQCTDVYY